MSLMNVVRIAKVIALLAFVLPWVAVSCQNVDVATASGIELIQGKMTANPDAEKQMGQRMGNILGAPPGSADTDGGFGGMRAGPSSQQIPDLGMNYFAVATAAVILIGLALSFLGKGKTAARNVMITGLLGAALAFGTVWSWKEQIKKEGGSENSSASSSPFGGGGGMEGMSGMGDQMANQMLQERFGYWICLIALLVAAGAGALGAAGGVPGAAATKPEGSPPAA